MAEESIVLPKNDGILPIKDKKQTIAVIGPVCDDVTVLLGNYNGTPSRYSTLLRGIQDAHEGRVIYARGSNLLLPAGRDFEKPLNEAIIAARKADIVIMCMGINPSCEGEENDACNSANNGDRDTIQFPETQRELMEEVMKVGKPTIFVNVSGSCMNLDFADKNCNAVLQCFYPGAEGGHALADILFGKVSPSGRLPVSFYRSTDDLPAFDDYSMENRTYKFFKGKCVYDFGHGLTYSEIKENWLDEKTVVLTNQGDFDTDYAVLRFEYIPHKSLCGFKKVHLKKGESLTVKFES
jgi:beta-glucosidase